MESHVVAGDEAPMQQGQSVPRTHEESGIIFVDLDGSLIATDLLFELMFALLRQQPWLALQLPLWLLSGRSRMKGEIANRISPDVAKLPYNSELLELLKIQREKQGTRVVLATASPKRWAESVAAQLGCFDAVLATEDGKNLKGARKLAAIREFCQTSGDVRYDYVGDAAADLPIWRESQTAYIVGGGDGDALTRRVRSFEPAVNVQPIGKPRKFWRPLVKALRPYQWSKNTLTFVPLLAGQKLFLFPLALVAFIAFSLCASAIYIINDLMDLSVDRAHPEKRHRPFASGGLPLAWGPPLALVLIVSAFSLSLATLPPVFCVVLIGYIALTTLYSVVIKSRLMVDVLALAILYSVRIFAGGVATGVVISEWLIAFSTFFFLSLAFVKRYTELHKAIETGRLEKLPGRGYRPVDIGMIESFGATSGYLAVFVLALYIQSEPVRSLYRSPHWLWGIGLVLVYWISRTWFLAKRGELPSDPVSFAIRDRNSRIAAILSLLFLAAGKWLPWP